MLKNFIFLLCCYTLVLSSVIRTSWCTTNINELIRKFKLNMAEWENRQKSQRQAVAAIFEIFQNPIHDVLVVYLVLQLEFHPNCTTIVAYRPLKEVVSSEF
ncbi:unnamed protein product [Meganyctiphanes norvegica]|uniref:Uncharacterized protein n=1 Tax=Meganyctiphanes norvegica TaxID=48144 RepID=A0AAV2PZ67_MEGNR